MGLTEMKTKFGDLDELEMCLTKGITALSKTEEVDDISPLLDASVNKLQEAERSLIEAIYRTHGVDGLREVAEAPDEKAKDISPQELSERIKKWLSRD